MVERVCGYAGTFDERIDPLKMEADWRADTLQDELIKLKSQCETRGRLSLSSIASRGQIQFHLISLFYSLSLSLALPIQPSNDVLQGLIFIKFLVILTAEVEEASEEF